MKKLVRAAVLALEPYTPGEQPSEPGLIKLNTNENPYPPSPAVARALAESNAETLRLYPDPVCRRLRGLIASQHGCAPENVFCGNGSDEILALCVRAFVECGGAVGFFSPSYSLYPVLAAAEERAAAPVELDEKFEWREPGRDSCSLFFLCNPNAPTGMLFPREKVAAFCRTFTGVVVLDEAYVDFASADMASEALRRENVLALRTLSKSYSLAGLRFGYALGHAALIEALFKLKDSYNVDRLAQALVEAALRDRPYMLANAARIKRERAALSAGLGRLGFFVFPSETNFIWVRPPRFAAAVWSEKLRAAGVLVRHFTGPRTAGFLRITVGTAEQTARLLEICGRITREEGA